MLERLGGGSSVSIINSSTFPILFNVVIIGGTISGMKSSSSLAGRPESARGFGLFCDLDTWVTASSAILRW